MNFYFWRVEKEGLVFILSKGRLIDGDKLANNKQIIESIGR